VQIALDAMGGDIGPQGLIAGALLAVEQTTDLPFIWLEMRRF
jgi:fatty acid/phospholipid biosynthesis enzyme